MSAGQGEHMSTNIGIDELLNEALGAYADLAGLKPIEMGVPYTWGQYEGSKQIDALNESHDLDPTGLTTFMLLRGLVDHFTNNAQFSAKYILTENDKFREEMKCIHRMVSMVENPQVVSLIAEFQIKLSALAVEFGVVDMQAYSNLLEDKYDLAYIRRDALRSIDRLEPFQFMQGKPDPNALLINKNVYEFWNINSLVQSLRDQQFTGVSLCLIRDSEEVMASYFVFAVKNGGTITILTDREEGPHPAFNRMTRRPDRDLERRAQRHWFPYHLLKLNRSEDGHLYEARNEGLVPYNPVAKVLNKIGELYPEEIVWTTLVLNLINDRYGKQHKLLPEMSYTGEMVVRPTALASADSGIVRSGDYRPLEVTPLKREDVTAETTKSQWVHEATGFNDWLVDKFEAQVPEELLNPVGEHQRLLLEAEHVDVLDIKKRERYGYMESQKNVETLSPVTFGTKEKLEKDRLWVARVNQCHVINELAKKEYEEKKAGVLQWCKERMEANKEFLLDACTRGELVLTDHHFTSWLDDGETREANCLRQGDKVWYDREAAYSWQSQLFLARRDFRKPPYWWCAVNDKAASLFSVIRPTCPSALAVVFGVKEDELPEPLQHWYSTEPYQGNSILQRLDPADWKINNPWMKFDTRIVVALSKSSYNELRKGLGLPKKEIQHGESE